jgi:hypothetical protein
MSFPASRFDRLLQSITNHDARHFKGALIDILDTAEVCSAWFEKMGLAHTAADVVAMAELVMVREEALVRNEADEEA